jgi:PKD repeat protein
MASDALERLWCCISRLTARVATCSFLLLATALPATAGTVSLAWNPVTATGLAGYMVYYGTSPGVYPTKINVGNVTTFTVPGLADTGTYYFVVTAYDGALIESAYSNSVAKAVVPSAPVRTAAFSASAVTGNAPLAVNFASYYTGTITSYAWTFGDGTTSSAANPVKTYTAPGTYSVTLTVTGPGGTDVQTRSNLITVLGAPVGPPVRISAFTASAVTGNAPLAVNFASFYSGSITTYAWTFGDGTTSSAANPTKTYTTPGTYTVSLTVTGPGGSDVQTRSNLITVAAARTADPAPVRVAELASSAVSGIAPLPVDFTSYYTGNITSYAWTFGDGTSSSDSNPSKLYAAPGVYTVSLTVTGPGGSDVQTKTNLVRVLPTPPTLMSRIGMVVDAHSATGTTSNLNGVFEPGETVMLEPTWRNQTAGAVTLSATASILPGPPEANVTLPGASAKFGAINPGTAANCQASTGICYQMAVAVPTKRPAVHWDAHITETLSNAVELSSPVHIGHSFLDVSENDPMYPDIETLLHNNVAAAYEDGTFRPWATSTRLDTAVFMARGLVAPVGDGAIPDSGQVGKLAYSCMPGGRSLLRDVSINSPECKYAHYLLAKGVEVEFGCTAKRLCAANETTRAAMAVMLAGSLVTGGDAAVPEAGTFSDSGSMRSYDCSVDGGSHFPDIRKSDAFCRHVNYLWARDMIKGNANGTFGPAAYVTRGEMAKVLVEGMALKLY